MSSSYNIDTLQYLQTLKRFATYETVWLGVLTYNFLCKNLVRIHAITERMDMTISFLTDVS